MSRKQERLRIERERHNCWRNRTNLEIGSMNLKTVSCSTSLLPWTITADSSKTLNLESRKRLMNLKKSSTILWAFRISFQAGRLRLPFRSDPSSQGCQELKKLFSAWGINWEKDTKLLRIMCKNWHKLSSK